VKYIFTCLTLFSLLSQVKAEPFPVSLSDALGRSITLKKAPLRIISLAPSNTEILFALGLKERMVGVTDYCDYPLEAKSLPKIGGFSNPNLEQIVSLSPDLVLAARFNPMEVLDALHELGVPVFAIAPTTLEETLQSLGEIGKLTGKVDQAKVLESALRERIADVTESVGKIPSGQRPKVLWGQLKAPMYTAGPGSFIHDLITMAGGRNIASDTGIAWPQLGLETIVTRNPDIIIVSGQKPDAIEKDIDRLQQVAGWNSIDAIKNRRVYEISLDLLGRPGPRLVTGLESLAHLLHPGLFSK
jgi:iron complex transport system substrate-binding protein